MPNLQVAEVTGAGAINPVWCNHSPVPFNELQQPVFYLDAYIDNKSIHARTMGKFF